MSAYVHYMFQSPDRINMDAIILTLYNSVNAWVTGRSLRPSFGHASLFSITLKLFFKIF